MIKPQPQHTPADLARIERVAPGAQSDAGRRLMQGLPGPLLGRLSTPTHILPDPAPGRRTRRHRIGDRRS